MVDGFKFQSPRCRHYFLTHYHADHTIGAAILSIFHSTSVLPCCMHHIEAASAGQCASLPSCYHLLLVVLSTHSEVITVC